MNANPRITLNHTMLDAAMLLCDGNPGAIVALLKLSEESSKIDPQSAWKEWGPFMSLDDYSIYGPDIHVLYKYVCGFSSLKVFTLLRAVQLGLLSEAELLSAIQLEKHSFDFDELLSKVQQQVTEFGRQE